MTKVARLRRGLLPLLTACVAAMAVALPATAAVQHAAHPAATRAGQWWLSALHVPAVLPAVPTAGKGVTVAVLSTGVDTRHPDLTGSVTAGPDFSSTGRTSGGEYWGAEGTAVASLIAGHGHGNAEGITGIAPEAGILSLQVTLEYDDPLNSDASVTRRLPAAIAAGIRYAVGKGATVIALPLDPGTLEAAPAGDPAAGGSAAEQAAISFALAHNVLLVAPAGDNGAGTGSVNYPAAYPGVIAVGATSRGGDLSLFTSAHNYVALTAPGSGITPDQPTTGVMTIDPAAGLTVAAPGGGYESLASTDMSAALTAGVAALIRSRYPWLTVAEVTQALEQGVTAPTGTAARPAAAGRGHGALDAAAALNSAAAIAAAHPAPATSGRPTTGPAGRPANGTARLVSAQSDPGHMLRSLVVGLAIAASALITCLVAATVLAMVLARLRRRGRSAGPPDITPMGRPGPARHAKGQPDLAAFPVPARVPWPSSPARPAPGDAGAATWMGAADGTSHPPRALGKPGRSYRQARRPAGNPPWQPANPPGNPGVPQVMLSAQPDPEATERPLAPWERSPADFAVAPALDDTAPRPVSNTGPMYVWNPAATGPIIIAKGDREPPYDGME